MILGHRAQLTLIEKILNVPKNHYSFLFTGPEKIGKKTLALFVFEKILQKDPFFHPDFFFLKEDDKNKISIKSVVESLIPFLSFSSFNAPFKCVLIDNAHSMTREAQQAFLKTLEEPKGKTIIILVSHLPEMLLSPLRSRLQRIVFFRPSKKEIEDFLKQREIKKELLQEILKFSFQEPSLVFQFLENKEKLSWVKERIGEFEKITKEPFHKRFSFAKEVAKKSNLLEILHLWLLYLRALFLAKMKDEKNQSEIFLKIKKMLEDLQDLIFLISFGKINKQLAIENFLLKA